MYNPFVTFHYLSFCRTSFLSFPYPFLSTLHILSLFVIPLPVFFLFFFKSFFSTPPVYPTAQPKYTVCVNKNFFCSHEERPRYAALLLQWLRRRATARCRCRAVHNTSSTSAELGNTRNHSAAGAVTSLDRGLLTHSTDNALSSVSSTSPPPIQTVSSSISSITETREYPLSTTGRIM